MIASMLLLIRSRTLTAELIGRGMVHHSGTYRALLPSKLDGAKVRPRRELAISKCMFSGIISVLQHPPVQHSRKCSVAS